MVFVRMDDSCAICCMYWNMYDVVCVWRPEDTL